MEKPRERDFLVFKPNPRTRGLEAFVVLVSVGLMLVVCGGAIMIMHDMEASSRHQGGRYYVAVAAIVALAWLETQIGKMVQRRRTHSLLGPDSVYSRPYALWSCLALTACGFALLAIAHLLP